MCVKPDNPCTGIFAEVYPEPHQFFSESPASMAGRYHKRVQRHNVFIRDRQSPWHFFVFRMLRMINNDGSHNFLICFQHKKGMLLHCPLRVFCNGVFSLLPVGVAKVFMLGKVIVDSIIQLTH